MERETGSVIYYSSNGWGFLADANEQSHFFHIKDTRPLGNGARVIPKNGDLFIFSLRPSTRKPGHDEAFDLEPVTSASPNVLAKVGA
jgi:hypothetical protein